MVTRAKGLDPTLVPYTLPGEGTRPCPDCGVKPGKKHHGGCDVERCSYCGGQWIQCGHKKHKPGKERWTGWWPGVLECRQRGWYAVFISGRGWQRVDETHPEKTEDLNRFAYAIQLERDKKTS